MHFIHSTFIAALLIIGVGFSARADGSAEAWQSKRALVDSRIRVESKQVNGSHFELIHLPNGEDVTIPVDLRSQEIVQSGLSPNEINQVREEARETLELTLQGLLSDDFNGTISVGQDADALSLQPVQAPAKKANIFKRIFSYNYELYKPMPQGLRASEKLKRMIQMTWQFVFVETIHAGINYYKQFRQVSSRFTEFGISIDLKLEPQLFLGKFNPTQKIKALSRNYALFFEIAYSRTQHRVLVRTRYRREKGAGGLGMPAVKAELKVFEADGRTGPYKGKSWYPVSPPLVSFVLDSSEHYFAQGVTVGFNSGDLVPGSTLANTFTQFVQNENEIKISEISQRTSEAFTNLASRSFQPNTRPHLKMCAQLFN